MQSNSFCNQKFNKQNLFCLTANLIACHDVFFPVVVPVNKVESVLRNFGKVKCVISYSSPSDKMSRKKRHVSKMFWEREIGTYSVTRRKPIKCRSRDFNLSWEILLLDLVIRHFTVIGHPRSSVFNLVKSRTAY